MKKKLYNTPLIEVMKIELTGTLLGTSTTNPVPPTGPAGVKPHRIPGVKLSPL